MRQAVVVIHGMGEQRPMDTLRGFSGVAVPAPAKAGSTRFHSKPDRISDAFELRRILAPGTRTRPITDLYEFYWAHHVTGSTLRHVWPLVRLLLLCRPSRVPGSLRFLWLSAWALVALLVTSLARNGLPDTWTPAGIAGSLGVTGWVSAALVVVLGVVQGFAVRYFGDVARYLHPAPGNVAIRHRIRSEGVALLRRLHECGKYDRVIVVGHSLGSVIALDLLGYLWNEYNELHDRPPRPVQECLEAVERLGAALPARPSEQQVRRFQEAQRALWVEQRRLGNPWLVTDFVVAGSPLAHAAMLLTRSAGELRGRQQAREIPHCPPQPDEGHYWFHRHYRTRSGKPRTVRVLHHAALFAVTRWSNVWFPSRFGVLGDWFGGPVAPAFGPGVRDLPVTAGRWWRHVPVWPHVRYFSDPDAATAALPGAAVRLLRDALDLDSCTWLQPVARADAE